MKLLKRIFILFSFFLIAISTPCSAKSFFDKDINNYSSSEQIIRLKENIELFKEIKNPTKEVQLAAVNQAPWIIGFIKNPDKDVQLEAVKEGGRVIQYIQNPGKDVQLKAVKNDGYALQYIENPDKEIQLVAVQQNGYAIQDIDYPDNDVQLAAICQTEDAIRYIANPSPEVRFKLYGTTSRPQNFKVLDDNIEIYIENNEIKILNRTNDFITIMSVAEYYGPDIYNNELGFTIPPQAVSSRKYKTPKSLSLKSFNDTFTYGFAVQYLLPNNIKKFSFFKTKNIIASDFIH